MKTITIAICAALLVCAFAQEVKNSTTVGANTNTTTKIDVNWSNDTQVVKLVGDVSTTTLGDKLLNASATEVGHFHEEVNNKINATLEVIEKSTTVLGAHEVSNNLNKSVTGNLTVLIGERTKLEAELHANASVWEEREQKIDAAHEIATDAKSEVQAALKAAIDVIIGKAEEKIDAVHVVAAVVKDSVIELKVNISKALVEYAKNNEAIVSLKVTSAGHINETVAAKIEVLVHANVEIKEELAHLAEDLAKNTAVLVTIQKEAQAIIAGAKEAVHEAHEKAIAIAEQKFHELAQVKEDIKANTTHAQEDIKEGINAFLENATVTKVEFTAGLNGDGNITVKIDLDVKSNTAAVKEEITAGVKIAIAAEVGAKPSNVTVHVTGGGLKRQAWTAEAELGPAEPTQVGPVDDDTGSASSLAVGAALLLALLGLFL